MRVWGWKIIASTKRRWLGPWCRCCTDRGRMADQGKLGLRFYQMAFCEGDKLYCGDDFDRVDGANGRFRPQLVSVVADWV